MGSEVPAQYILKNNLKPCRAALYNHQYSKARSHFWVRMHSPFFRNVALRHWIIGGRHFETAQWSSSVEIPSLETSALADEITRPFRNFWHRFPSDTAPHPRRREISVSHIFARLERIIILTLVPSNYDVTLLRKNNLSWTFNSIPRICNGQNEWSYFVPVGIVTQLNTFLRY